MQCQCIVSRRSCGLSPHIFEVYHFFSGPQFETNWLRELRTIAIPVYFMVLNFDYGIQLSRIHVSKYCLMPVTFYPSVVILRGGREMGIEIEYLPGGILY